MERKTLSNSFKVDKVLTFVMAAGFLLGWIFVIHVLGFLLFGAMFVTIMGLIAFFPRKIIQFDDNNMYILNDGSEVSIELKKVSSVSMTSFSLNNRRRWKIEYWLDGSQDIGFFPGSYSTLDNFIDLVKQHSPDAKIVRSIGFMNLFNN